MLGAGMKCRSGKVVRMAEQFVGKISEFGEGERRIVFVGDREIGVFREGGRFTPTAMSACIRAGRLARG